MQGNEWNGYNNNSQKKTACIHCIFPIPPEKERETPILTVFLDGKPVLEEPLPITKTWKKAPGEDYRRRYSFPVSKGEHLIRVENSGKGWFAFALSLENHRICRGPDLQVRGLQSSDWILLWLRHPAYNWLYDKMNIKPVTQPSGKLVLRDVHEGKYHLRWINTRNGNVLKEEDIEVNSVGQLKCITPLIKASAACLIHRLSN